MIGSSPDLMNDIHLFHNSGNKKSNEHHFDGLFPKQKAKQSLKKDKSFKINKSKNKRTKKRTNKRTNKRTKKRTKRR